MTVAARSAVEAFAAMGLQGTVLALLALAVVRAGALLLAIGKDYRFLLIGDGPERVSAERLAEAWPGRFEFTGAVPYDAVPGLLAQATVGVAPLVAAHPSGALDPPGTLDP